MIARFLVAASAILAVAAPAIAQDSNYTRIDDVIYGRKHGLAMTMDVFTPKEKANGKGVIFCVCGGWFSNKPGSSVSAYFKPFLDRGYIVFAVVHGSQPKFTIPEVLEDMHRAVRFIRHNAKKYGVDPEKLGIAGGSAGGHLSLMQGTAPKAGDPKADGPRRAGVVEGRGGRVLLPADRLPELRQARERRARRRDAQGFPTRRSTSGNATRRRTSSW